MNKFIPFLAILCSIPAVNAMEKYKSNTQQIVLDQQLITAAKRCDKQAFQKALGKGADVNAVDEEHQATALHWAIGAPGLSKTQRYAFIKFLLEETKIDVNKKNKMGSTPLVFALFNQLLDIATLILEQTQTDVNIFNESGDTAMTYATKIENKSILELLVKKGGKKSDGVVSRLLFAREDGGRTAEFMENGHEPFNELIASLKTELYSQTLKLAKEILAKKERWAGWNAFFLAIAQNRIEVVKVLIEAGIQFDRHYETGSGYSTRSESPIELAQFYRHNEIEALLQQYKDFIKACLENTATAETVKAFKAAGLFINFRSIGSVYGDTRISGGAEGNKTALHCAVKNNNLGLVKALVEAGADLDAQDCNGLTPLNFAAALEDDALLRYLIKCNANLTIALKNSRDEQEKQALLKAVQF